VSWYHIVSMIIIQAFGNNLITLPDGWWVVYGGDINQDGLIDAGDMTPVDNDLSNYLASYLNSDANGDGMADSIGITIVDNSASNFVAGIHP